MTNKRNGSGPPPPPQRNGSYQVAPYQLDDDDEHDHHRPRGGGLELVDDDDVLDDEVDAEAVEEEEEFVDSALVREVPARAAPPPAPRGNGGAFLDDGEIALPPGLSQVVRSNAGHFPFRDVLDDDDDDADPHQHAYDDDDDAAPVTAHDAVLPADDDDDAPVAARGIRVDDDDDFTPPADDDDAPIAAPGLPADDDEDDFAPAHAAGLPDDDDDAPPPAMIPRGWSQGPVLDDEIPRRIERTEDDFGDLNEPSRAMQVPASPPPPARPARAEDDFGDLNEPSRALHAAVDLSGLAPVPAAEIDDTPLPPPPMTDFSSDDSGLPPLIAAASSSQSGAAFSQSELELDEPAPDPEPEPDEPLRPFSAAPAPWDSHARAEPVHPLEAAPAPEPEDEDDDDDGLYAPAAGLAPAPSEPLGEPFPLDLWSDPDELIGRDLGRYRLVKPLSRGLTTRVYAAIDEHSGRHVAIRILGPTHSPAERRARQFLYEAQQLAKLKHESIVEVIDTGATNDYLSYYVMERLEGDSLAALLRLDGPLPWQQVAILTTQICEALIVAADRNIIATDLNLGTVIRLREEAEDARRRHPIKLLGVGVSPIASVYRSPDGNLVESKGTPPGAAEYMAPEVASGGFPDPTSAVYALGVMMYELLTGRPPYRGESFLAVIKKQMYEEPQPPHLVVPQQEIAEPFEQVILKALAKDPSRRFQTIRALHEAVLAARAREGELRRATAILSLDPAAWDDESARKDEPSRPLPQYKSEPLPLRTFTADLRKSDPGLAEAVLGASSAPVAAPRQSSAPAPRSNELSEPRAIPIPQEIAARPVPRPVSAVAPIAAPVPAPRAEPSTVLSQLAPPIRAPEPVLAPQPSAAPQAPLIVRVQAPPADTGPNIRNISIAVVICSALVFLWMSRGPAQPTNNARKGDPVADAGKRAAKDTSKPRKPPREPRTREPEPDPQPIVVRAPEPVVAPPTEPVPEAISPPPEAKTEPPPPEPTPEPVVENKPPEPPPVEVKPEPVVEAKPPEPTPAEPPKTEPKPEVKPKPVKPKPASDLPARIEPIRLKSRYAALEPRIAAKCASMSGLGAGARVTIDVKITVDTQGVVRATALRNWAGTPLGRCVEDMVESIRFNETQYGGSRTHTFSL